MLRHELSAPLAAVTALVGMLATEDGEHAVPDARRGEIARLAYWQARHMAALLAGGGTGTRAFIEVIAAAGVAAGVPQARLHAEVTAEAADTAVDARPVQQVLTNLLVNAVRHGAPDTQIRLTARIEPTGRRGSLVVAVHNRLAAAFQPRPEGRGLRIVNDIVDHARGSFTMRPGRYDVVAEARLPVLL